MDDDRFDSLTAGLASSSTRRSALRILAMLVAGLASLFGWSENHPAETKKRQRNHRHKKAADKRQSKRKRKGKGKGKGKNRDKGKGEQCSSESRQCNGECIDSSACCSSEECGQDEVCDEQHACVCAPEHKRCEGACIAESECCDDCPDGMACQEGECVCAPGYKPCGGDCILDTDCCGGCPQGMTCEASNCVCAPQHKACGDVCIPDSECCDGCPNGMTCEEGECICAPEHKPCGEICIPNTECCGGCSDGAICLAGGECSGKPLYPDLRPLPPSELEFDVLIDTLGNLTHILRLSNTVWNAGEGRLELEGDSDPDPNASNKVYQNLYDAPTGGNLVSHKLVARDLIYHEGHKHFHLADFASYLLLARDSTGIYLPTTKEGTKTSFCIMDTDHIEGPYSKRYRTCGTDLQGLTPGWADTYRYYLDDQWVVLGSASLSDGEYAIQSIADPEGILNEGGPDRESNNSAVTYFTVENGAIVNVRDKP